MEQLDEALDVAFDFVNENLRGHSHEKRVKRKISRFENKIQVKFKTQFLISAGDYLFLAFNWRIGKYLYRDTAE